VKMATPGNALKSAAETASGPERPIHAAGESEVRLRGKAQKLPTAEIDGKTVFTTGKWLRVASVCDEELVEGDTVSDPESFVPRLKASGLRADLFTFAQRLPHTAPKHSYPIEWENAAALPITKYSEWWKERTEYSIRKGVNRARKLGVVVKAVEFDDALLDGICSIYNESPVRQGKAFWHYGKDQLTVKRALATYLERSVFLGAYYQDELIGFMKITHVGPAAVITQILSAKRHFDKRPNNALIAKAIELCELWGSSYFIYGSFVYYDADSKLTEFKRRNGFEAIPLPRYYVPLTLKGRLALRLRLHRGIVGNIPIPIFRALSKLRRAWYARRLKAPQEVS
jgi:hypothetical protein